MLGEPSTLGDTNAWTNLNTFSSNGGKLLFYHGVRDPWFSSLDTVQYYEKLAAASGGIDATRGWSRLFRARHGPLQRRIDARLQFRIRSTRTTRLRQRRGRRELRVPLTLL